MWVRVLGALVVSAFLAGTTASPAGAAWGGPYTLLPPGNAGITGVACPSATQCTAIANAAVTFNPQAPGSPTPFALGTGQVSLLGIACPSTAQCTVVGGAEAYTFDPVSHGSQVTTPFNSAGGNLITAVACPSVSLCVGVGDNGAQVTFNPASSSTPTTNTLDGGNTMDAVACPSAAECAAVDTSGGEIAFDPSNPGNPPSVPVDAKELDGLACPSVHQCTATDGAGGAVFTFDPSAPGVPHPVMVDAGGVFQIACPSLGECVAGDGVGQALIFDPSDPTPNTLSLVDPQYPFSATACATATECVLGDVHGRVYVGIGATSGGGGGSGPGGGGGPGPGGGGHSGRARIVHVHVAGGSVTVALNCQGGTCRLMLHLTVVETLRHGKVIGLGARLRGTHKLVTLASASPSLAAGTAKTATLRLGSKGHALLREFHHFAAKLTVTTPGAAKPLLVKTVLV
jgi:hypothetical protein